MNPNGRKINSRGTADAEGGSFTGSDGEDWWSIAVSIWFLALKEGVLQHALASPFEVSEISTETNREQRRGRINIRVGASGKRALLDVKRNEQHYRLHSGEVEYGPCLTGNDNGKREMPDPTYRYLR